jgi:hypothetical protein
MRDYLINGGWVSTWYYAVETNTKNSRATPAGQVGAIHTLIFILRWAT